MDGGCVPLRGLVGFVYCLVKVRVRDADMMMKLGARGCQAVIEPTRLIY